MFAWQIVIARNLNVIGRFKFGAKCGSIMMIACNSTWLVSSNLALNLYRAMYDFISILSNTILQCLCCLCWLEGFYFTVNRIKGIKGRVFFGLLVVARFWTLVCCLALGLSALPRRPGSNLALPFPKILSCDVTRFTSWRVLCWTCCLDWVFPSPCSRWTGWPTTIGQNHSISLAF